MGWDVELRAATAMTAVSPIQAISMDLNGVELISEQ